MNFIKFVIICLVSCKLIKCDGQSKVNEEIDLSERFSNARIQFRQRSNDDNSQQQKDAAIIHFRCITCEAKLEELQRNLTNIINSYTNLCNGIRRISESLSLHEQAIENIAVNILRANTNQRNQQNCNECIGFGCNYATQNSQQPVIHNASDINSHVHRTRDHAHVYESQSQSQSHHSFRQRVSETKVIREQRVVNNGTHTIYYSTVQKEENGVKSRPETSVRVFRNSPDQQIYQNQEKIKFDDFTQKRQRRSSEKLETLEGVTKATKTFIEEDNIELISQRTNDISPDELKDINTDMPWEVDDQKPIPFQRKPKQVINFDDNTSEQKCRGHQSNCFTNQCNQFSTTPRKSTIFQEKYKKWVQSLLGNQSTEPNCILYENYLPQSMDAANDYQIFDGAQQYDRRVKQQNEQSIVEGKKFDETKANQFETNDADTIYASCSMIANRHIPLILQEDIEGTINMWQSRRGGPLFMHVKLRGFKTRLTNEHLRVRRESNIVEVRVPYNQSSVKCLRGFHIHQFGNLTKGCHYTGTHYNPKRLLHGGPSHIIRHIGDLGNIDCNRNGTVNMKLVFDKVSLLGEYSIIGRSVVIHSQRDDFGRNPSDAGSASNGNSGPKIACCVIEKVDRLPQLE